MKNHLKQFLIIIPLLLIAGVSFAAYSFVAPNTPPGCASGTTAGTPPNCNTDSPLDISATDQVKDGGLSVNTFQSRTGSDFVQQTAFTGLVNGGTNTVTSSTIPFGTTAKKVSISQSGNTKIVGTYQSDSLKTGGGSKPLCASTDGTFYICGAAAAPTNPNPIYVSATMQLFGAGMSGTEAGAHLSEATNAPVTVTIAASSAASGGSNPLSYLKNMFTANARFSGVCYYTSTPTDVGTVTIYGGQTDSDQIPLPAGCDSSNTYLSISSYSPHTTMGGRSVIAR